METCFAFLKFMDENLFCLILGLIGGTDKNATKELKGPYRIVDDKISTKSRRKQQVQIGKVKQLIMIERNAKINTEQNEIYK